MTTADDCEGEYIRRSEMFPTELGALDPSCLASVDSHDDIELPECRRIQSSEPRRNVSTRFSEHEEWEEDGDELFR